MCTARNTPAYLRARVPVATPAHTLHEVPVQLALAVAPTVLAAADLPDSQHTNQLGTQVFRVMRLSLRLLFAR
jgi:hypothetical protein